MIADGRAQKLTGFSFDSQYFMPHGHCYLWEPGILWLHFISDGLIALAYFSIPIALVYFVRKRRDLEFRHIFLLFAAFIIACGTTHVFEVWTIWNPDYAVQGLIKFLTALISVTTALVLWPAIPRLLASPSPEKYRQLVVQLEKEIASRELAQEELRRSEHLVRLTTDHLPVAISYLDDGRSCKFANATFFSWFNENRFLRPGFHYDDIAGIPPVEPIDRCFDRTLNIDTATRSLSIVSIPDTDSRGQIKGIIQLFTDVTQHKQSEKELRDAKEQADAANVAKNTFIANMSHEIRTPLGAIIGYCNLLLNHKHAPQDERPLLDSIMRNGDLLLCIINDILDISKIEAERLVIERQKIEIQQTVSEIFELLEDRAIKKGLRIQVHYAPDLPVYIESDPARLKQILINLLGNAIKFSDSGTIHLSVEMLYGDAQKPQIAFIVNDEGIGIPKDKQASLFQAFTQLDPTASRSYGGTGLGLALSKRLAIFMGGDATLVQSEPGIGSTFMFTIDPGKIDRVSSKPSEINRTSILPKGSLGINLLRGLTLLVADDAPDNQYIINRYLSFEGAEVDTAANGKEAIEMHNKRPYDLILMDLQMPVINGFEALGNLRKLGCSIPVIALTAHAMTEHKNRCLEAGFIDHIAKPVNFDELIDKILRHSVKKSNGSMACGLHS